MTTVAAIYARYSTDRQDARSIDDQLRRCRRFAQDRGWKVAAEFSDAAQSGATLAREAMQRLLAAARARPAPFEAVLVDDLSRLSRDLGGFWKTVFEDLAGAGAKGDRADLAWLFQLAQAKAFDELRLRHVDRLTRDPDPRERAAIFGALMDAGAVVVEASGRVIDPADEMGELDLSLQGWIAARERKRIAERTMAAKRRLAATGRLVSSTPPWGRAFDKVTGKWSLSPGAKDYRRVFDLALRGDSLWTIARRLDAEGISSPKGKPWTAQMVRNLLHAPHAAGRWRSHGAEALIPAVVDRATQDRVVAILRSHDQSGGRHAVHPALFRRVLRCGMCGAAMHTNKSTGGEPYYHCSARDPRCYRAHNVASVDDAAWSRIRAWLRSRGAIAAGEASGGGDDESALQRAAKDAEQALLAVDREEERVGRLATRGALTERVAGKLLREVAARRAEAEADLRRARELLASAETRRQLSTSLALYVARMRKGIETATFAERRDAVERLFPEMPYHVALWPDGRLRLRAAIPLDGRGEDALRKAGAPGNPARPSRETFMIPVTLLART